MGCLRTDTRLALVERIEGFLEIEPHVRVFKYLLGLDAPLLTQYIVVPTLLVIIQTQFLRS